MTHQFKRSATLIGEPLVQASSENKNWIKLLCLIWLPQPHDSECAIKGSQVFLLVALEVWLMMLPLERLMSEKRVLDTLLNKRRSGAGADFCPSGSNYT